jgi:plastocyanin
MKAARFAMAAGALLFFAMATSASAAVRAVDNVGFKFEPQSVTITAEDTVTWTNRDAAAHSARVNGIGTTAVLTQGQSGSLRFMNAGTFPYDCGIHGASMMGTVIVRAAATPPPTPVPTPRPTVARTIAPTVAPTLVSTPVPTVAVVASASPTPTPSVAPTTPAASVTPLPSVAVAVPTEQAPAPGAGGGTSSAALLVGGAMLVLLAVGAFALTRIKR